MKPTRSTIPHFEYTLLAALVAAWAAPSHAQEAPLFEHARADQARMLYDEPGDGRVWAAGTRYKASFGSDGAVFIPAFGSQAPHNFPHALSPDRVTVNGEPIAFESRVDARRETDRISFERGAFVERYDLALESLEQSFVFDQLPRAGELVLHIPVASELVASEGDDGLAFSSDFGTLTYSRAIAIDATGRRFSAPTHLVDGAIVISVTAADIARATFPLVIDPVVGTLAVISTTDDTREPDLAYDAFDNLWLLTWTVAFSATDLDVRARTVFSTGSIDTAIDITTESWDVPRSAYLAFSHTFLVVASTGQHIKGRIVDPNGTINVVGPQVLISGSDTGAKTNPDVGGDSTSSTTNHFCVVWERAGATHGTGIIAARLLTPTGGVLGANATYLTNSLFESGVRPTISKSPNGSEWLMAFTYSDALAPANIYAARIQTNGPIPTSGFAVTGGSSYSRQPVVSSFQTNTTRAMIAYRNSATTSGQGDIWVALLDGSSVLSRTNLTALENSGFQSRDQTDPAIDCDGQHFVVAYSEFDANFSTWSILVTDIATAANDLDLVQTRVPDLHLGLSELRTQVVAQRNTSGALSQRFGIGYHVRQSDQNYDIFSKTFDAFEGGSIESFCTSATIACPCGNGGISTNGCANSQVPFGGFMNVHAGLSSTVNDSLVLNASGLPAGTTCLLFQGTAAGLPQFFGDGALCTSGTITRIVVRSVATTFLRYPQVGDPSLSITGGVPIGGGLRTYQTWYRDTAGFCTSATSNVTSGLLVNWAR